MSLNHMSLTIARRGLAALALTVALATGAALGADTPHHPREASEPARAAPTSPSTAPAPLPPIVSFSRSNSGWSANFSFADPVTEIQWSLAKDGPFEPTGFLP